MNCYEVEPLPLASCLLRRPKCEWDEIVEVLQLWYIPPQCEWDSNVVVLLQPMPDYLRIHLPKQ